MFVENFDYHSSARLSSYRYYPRQYLYLKPWVRRNTTSLLNEIRASDVRPYLNAPTLVDVKGTRFACLSTPLVGVRRVRDVCGSRSVQISSKYKRSTRSSDLTNFTVPRNSAKKKKKKYIFT